MTTQNDFSVWKYWKHRSVDDCGWDEIQRLEISETISNVFIVPEVFCPIPKLSVFPDMILGDGIPLAEVWGNT